MRSPDRQDLGSVYPFRVDWLRPAVRIPGDVRTKTKSATLAIRDRSMFRQGDKSPMTRKRQKRVRPRNPYVELMRLTRKPGAHKDRRKEIDRLACRSFKRRRWDEE
jgi:hypothetical protein